MNAERIDNGDKLRHGPCAKQYIDLEDCAADKKVRSHAVSPNNRRTRQATMAKISQFFFTIMMPLFSHAFLCVVIIISGLTQEKLVRCPRQTDVLIQCMKKNPLFFHSNQVNRK